MSAAVKSLEDHGYILDLGVPEVSGFLSFKDAKKGPFDKNTRLHVGRILDVTIAGMMSNGRTCKVNIDSAAFSSSSVCLHVWLLYSQNMLSELLVFSFPKYRT